MSLKESILAYLENSKGVSVSGERLAEEFEVSRSAVWKAIEALRKDGYIINATSNKGYSFGGENNIVSAAGISAWSEILKPENIFIFKEVDSTNLKAKELASKGAEHGTLVVAERQTAGRGRMGRKFVSPAGSGIYMTLIIRPKADLGKAMLITSAAAVAVCKAIRELTGKAAGIKWVNDIYIEEKKVCGILTEAVTDVETGDLESAVIGIGINFTADPEVFPEDVKQRVCWIYENKDEAADVTRNRLIAAVMDEVMRLCENLDDKSFMEYYREHSIVIGRDIVFIRGDERQPAKVTGVDDNGGLIVVKNDGSREVLASGEISIRW